MENYWHWNKIYKCQYLLIACLLSAERCASTTVQTFYHSIILSPKSPRYPHLCCVQSGHLGHSCPRHASAGATMGSSACFSMSDWISSRFSGDLWPPKNIQVGGWAKLGPCDRLPSHPGCISDLYLVYCTQHRVQIHNNLDHDKAVTDDESGRWRKEGWRFFLCSFKDWWSILDLLWSCSKCNQTWDLLKVKVFLNPGLLHKKNVSLLVLEFLKSQIISSLLHKKTISLSVIRFLQSQISPSLSLRCFAYSIW